MSRARWGLVLLAVAAAAYPIVALQSPPGFFEGFCPPVDYRFVSPPKGVAVTRAPGAAHADIKVVKGVVNLGFVATSEDNPQAILSFVPGAFQAPSDGASVAVDIKPVKSFPAPTGITLVTNVYQLSASAPIVKPSNLRLLYSTVLPAPSTIYQADPGGAWKPVSSNPSSGSGCTDVVAQVSSVGLYAAGYPGSSSNPQSGGSKIGGGQTLPIIAALVIVIVVLAGIPLAVVRRRRVAPAADPAKPPPRRRT